MAAYVRKFEVAKSHSTMIEVAADQKYELYLDGELLGRGGESGDLDHWYFDCYDLTLLRGPHVLSAKVWSWGGSCSAMAQMELAHGFFLSASREPSRRLLGTGIAAWEVKALSGNSFTEHENLPNGWTGVPPSQTLDGNSFPWTWKAGAGEGWQTPEGLDAPSGSVAEGAAGRRLRKAELPPLFSSPVLQGEVVFVSDRVAGLGPLRDRENRKEEYALFEPLIRGQEISLPAGMERRVLFDLKNYFCAYPTVESSGGKSGHVRLTWAESLFEGAKSMEKGNRNTVLNKYMRGIWDEFRFDGESARLYDTLTWRAGRYLELKIVSGVEPLRLKLNLLETRFDLPIHNFFSCCSEPVNAILPSAVRSLQMSAHDNFVDCPFYERLLYAGDGRLEALVSYAISGDDFLTRKAIQLFASSAKANGLCMSRWPSREVQYIPTFSLWWIGMVYDFSMWRDDRSLVRSVMPAVRSTLEYFLERLDARGIYTEKKAVWNFVDWVPDWKEHPNGGVPPSLEGINFVVNCILKYTLSLGAKLESYLGATDSARRYELAASTLDHILPKLFWDQKRKLFADEESGKWFSEHAQILAILGGLVSPEERGPLLDAMKARKSIAGASLFFTHYLFEACFLSRREDLFFERLQSWNGFVASGLMTVPENFTDSRSDCHGWGAHPLFHLVANVAGIRPAAPGFKQVRIAPQLGPLRELSAACPHPAGMIRAQYRLQKDRATASIALPPGLSGEFVFGRDKIAIRPGEQTLRLTCHGLDRK